MVRYTKQCVKWFVNALGFELCRKNDIPKYSRCSMRGCLMQACLNGLNPATVIDVGAAYGTKELYEVFPHARTILIEPLEEFAPYLEAVTKKLARADYIRAAAAAVPGEATIHVHPDLEGSSLFQEQEDSDVNGQPRVITTVTLDEVCGRLGARGPFLLKIDTQGSELETLRGAGGIIKECDFIVMEVSFFECYRNGPQAHECIQFMREKGFVMYDAFGFLYRPLDGALIQCDIAFVPEAGSLRRHHHYATVAQRQEHNRIFKKHRPHC